ncbi:hypothetical protein ACIQYS_20685 [Psychrobacillus sp. NPDC096426]|uniref:hypothetical protein n=1 Tax=Psychrobacillus sp. NPDC096426 TaxID=3364491 RepID=UPI00381BF077
MKKYTLNVEFKDGRIKQYETDEKVQFENEAVLLVGGLRINIYNVEHYSIIENIKTM